MQKEAGEEGNKIKKRNAKSRNNTIVGKLVENSMKKVSIKTVITRNQLLNRSFRKTFKREKQFRNGAIAIEKEKGWINLNKTHSREIYKREKYKQTNYYQPNKDKLCKRSRLYYRNLSEDEKIKKRNYSMIK